MRFKKGSIVRVITDLPIKNLTKGTLLEVDDSFEDTVPICVRLGLNKEETNNRICVSSSDLELANEQINKPINKFKIGDRVIYKKDNKIYYITYIAGDFCCLGTNLKYGVIGGVKIKEELEFVSTITYSDSIPTSIKTNKINKIMSYLKTVSIKLRAKLGDDIANQIIAGLRNEDLSLTTDGRNAILESLADEAIGAKALNAKADEIIKEAKKEEAKND